MQPAPNQLTKLYTDPDGKRVVLEGEAINLFDTSKIIFTFRGVNEDGDLSGLYYMSPEEFHARYKRVEWKNDVDIYALCHQKLDRYRAHELADQIATALQIAEQQER